MNALVATGALKGGRATSLKSTLGGAEKNLAQGNVSEAIEKLQSAIDQLDALMRAGILSADGGMPIRTLLVRTIQSLSH